MYPIEHQCPILERFLFILISKTISLKKIIIPRMIPDFLISKYSLSKFIFAYSTNELP